MLGSLDEHVFVALYPACRTGLTSLLERPASLSVIFALRTTWWAVPGVTIKQTVSKPSVSIHDWLPHFAGSRDHNEPSSHTRLVSAWCVRMHMLHSDGKSMLCVLAMCLMCVCVYVCVTR